MAPQSIIFHLKCHFAFIIYYLSSLLKPQASVKLLLLPRIDEVLKADENQCFIFQTNKYEQILNLYDFKNSILPVVVARADCS